MSTVRCDESDETQLWIHTSSKELKHVSSNKCVAAWGNCHRKDWAIDMYNCTDGKIERDQRDQVYEMVKDSRGSVQFKNELCPIKDGRKCLGVYEQYENLPWVTAWVSCEQAAFWVKI